MKRTIVIIAGILVLLLLGLVILLVSMEQTKNSPLIPSGFPQPSPSSILPTPDPDHKLTYSGWIPYWGSPEGFTSLKAHSTELTSISPVWYEVNADGSLVKKFPANKDQIQQYALSKGIALYPTVSLNDHDIFTGILQDQINLDRHIQAILAEVFINNYDGIDLDYESTSLTDKSQYFLFLSRLSEMLHQQNKKLIVTVLAKWGDDIVYPSLPETRQVQDWALIGPLADEVRIMAYDYTYSRSYYPGPIAPTGWIQDVLEYALTKLPAKKIILGIHLYSYEWSIAQSADQLDFIVDYHANKQSDQTARSYDYLTVKTVLQQNQGLISTYQGENIFRYNKNVNGTIEKRVLVYITPEGVNERINLAKSYGVKGVVFWRLGNDADLF
jgi:spore germination protein YaaH